MEIYIHYKALPPTLSLPEVVQQLNDTLEEHGAVSGGQAGRIDLTLEDETINPKYAQMAVKAYLQRVNFPRDTKIEIGGMEIGVYE